MKNAASNVIELEEKDGPGHTMPDGSYVVSPEQLKRLGNGDVKSGRRWLRILMSESIDPPNIDGPTDRPATVRLAYEEDELAIFDMLVASYKENAASVFPLAPHRLIEDIQNATQQRGGICGLIDDPETGEPIAVILMHAAQWPASNAWGLRELYTYVKPEHRKSKHAEHLVKFARWCSEEWTKGFGYPVYIALSVVTEQNVGSKIRFFKRFANQVGAVFMYPTPVKGR